MKILLSIMLLVGVCCSAFADDLCKVAVGSADDAELLKSVGVVPVTSLHDGYLILADAVDLDMLRKAGLDIQLLASDVSTERLVWVRSDGRQPTAIVNEAYRIGEVVLCVLNEPLAETADRTGLFPVVSGRTRIEYSEPQAIETDAADLDISLDSLIGLVERDTVEAYLYRLEAFDRRLTGTDSCRAAANWIKARFESFGYDSVRLDSFTGSQLWERVPVESQNVVAVKIGSHFPDQQIIVGGHFDAVPDCPGADDNGTGTVGVLEIARVLANIETEMTFVFIAFDSEESWMWGSYHYADMAVMRGDDIIYMMNLDMIGHWENHDWANLYYGADVSFSELWQQLADSLVSITGDLSGSTASDHLPFQEYGFPVTFVQEGIFSDNYHMETDSTTYINFEYMTRMIQASLATVYVSSQTIVPPPALAFSYPNGVPSMIRPGRSTELEVVVEGACDGAPVPGSGEFHYSIDGAEYVSAPMVEASPGQYLATIPPLECPSRVWFYVSADETLSGEFVDPGELQPFQAHAATGVEALFEDDFETDKNWITTWVSSTNGRWVRAKPASNTESVRDPVCDADGSGYCYVTGNGSGDDDVDEGSVLLWTPHLDLTTGAAIEYDYYLNLSRSGDGVDRMAVQIADYTSEVNWIEIASHETTGGLFWRHHEISQADLVAAGVEPTWKMRMRFVVNDSDPQSTVEAGIDAFKLNLYSCEEITCCGQYTGGYTGNTNSDIEGKRNLADISKLIDRVYLSKAPLDCEDNGNVNGDLEFKINLADISRLIDHVYVTKAETAACP